MRAALLALIALSAPVDAKCMMMEAAPKLLTPANATIPADGGVLVQQELVHDAPQFDGDASIQPSWKLDIETLAPGLSVYRSKTKTIEIPTKKKATYKVGAAAANPLAAPAPTSLTILSARGIRGNDEHSIIAAFPAIPAGAVAVVLYKLDGGKRIAQSWGLVGNGQDANSVAVYEAPGHCGWNPPGTTLPTVADKLALAWVDAYGRLSPVSGALTMVPGKSH